MTRKTLVVVLGLVSVLTAALAEPALALNPQPLPPMRRCLVCTSSLTASAWAGHGYRYHRGR
jgi:hypothetical protein